MAYQFNQPNWMYQNNYPNYSQNSMPQYPNYAQQPQQSIAYSMIGVDGEVGAKAYQMPQGWPANLPIPLWDTNDTVIYLKSINQMGMPNPLQKIRYTIEDQQPKQSMLPAAAQQGNSYATKEDMESMRSEMRELRDMLKNQSNNSNRNNNNQQNRGGQ